MRLPRLAGLALLAAGAARACPIEAMQAATIPAAATAAYEAVLDAGADCTAEQRNWSARRAAALHLQQAARLQQEAQPPQAVLRLLDEALRFAPVWQAYAMRGDLRQRLPGADYAQASQDYQSALAEIAENPAAQVPDGTIAALFRKAEQTRLLAERPVPAPLLRSGAPAGLAATRIRSFAPMVVAMPIQFEFGSANFTPGGMRAAEALASMLGAEGRPPIRLNGHTDPVGSAEANRLLSLRRAQAVAQFLVSQGYQPGLIEVAGMGASAPLRIEDPAIYSQAQVHQILRRVELVRR